MEYILQTTGTNAQVLNLTVTLIKKTDVSEKSASSNFMLLIRWLIKFNKILYQIWVEDIF